MATIDDIERKIKHYRWLQGFAKQYEDFIDLIEREKDYLQIHRIEYSAREDSTHKFNLNPHRSIPNEYIRNGLQVVLYKIKSEMEEIEEELHFERKTDNQSI